MGNWYHVIETIKNKFNKLPLVNENQSLESEMSELIHLFKKGLYDQVIEKGKQVYSKFEKSHMVTNIIGSAYLKIKDYNQAKIYHEKTIGLNRNFPEGYYNLGYTYWQLGQLDLAEKNCLKAINTKPSNHLLGFVNNMLGTLFELKNDLIGAKKFYYKAFNLNNSYHEPIFHYSLIHLYLGNFEIGWKYYEHRWKTSGYLSKIKQGNPTWSNSLNRQYWSPSVSKDHHITIWPEQGIGDHILMCRFLNDLKNFNDHITVLVYDKLKPIYERTFPHIKFVTELNTGAIDYHAPIGDLAKFYVNSFDDVKARSGVYLSVDKSRTKKIKTLLPKGKKICGISWVSKNESIGKNKSMTLEDLKDLLLLPDMIFVDLQYTDTSQERALFKDKHGVEILKLEEIDNFNDIDGLASLIDACDYVVSVSNTTVHIAGSIGKETYLMLPQGKGRLWYWSKEEEQSIWYKSVQVVEQTEMGNWYHVIETIKNKFE